MFAHLGVASFGLEIGDDFYQDCANFEAKVYPDNVNTLLYAIKLAKKPNKLIKGPDVLDISVTESDVDITISVDASDSELVNIDGYSSFATGEQTISKIELYLDVLPGDYGDGDTMYLLQPLPIVNSDRVSAETEFSKAGLASGRHVVYAVATDSDGYTGPVSSVFFEVENAATSSPIAPTSFPSVAVQTTTTTFTTTTQIETDQPSKEPTATLVTDQPSSTKSTRAPSNKPSSAPVADESSSAPTGGKVSSLAPTAVSTSMGSISSIPTADSATASPSVTNTRRVGSSPAPTVVEVTDSPSADGNVSESKVPTSSPSVETLDGTPADTFSEVDGSSAATTSVHMIAPLALFLLTCLL